MKVFNLKFVYSVLLPLSAGLFVICNAMEMTQPAHGAGMMQVCGIHRLLQDAHVI